MAQRRKWFDAKRRIHEIRGVATYEIDGKNFDTLDGFYEEISRVLIPGADWGRNLDAFNDILRGGFGTPDGGFVVLWKNHEISKKRLGHEETARVLEKRLEECHPTNRGIVRKNLDRARRGDGPTVFDWLIEILDVHGPGGAESDDGVTYSLR